MWAVDEYGNLINLEMFDTVQLVNGVSEDLQHVVHRIVAERFGDNSAVIFEGGERARKNAHTKIQEALGAINLWTKN